MGKSPARWIKTVLFGKKHSKTNASKNVTPDKKSAPKKAVENLGGNPSVLSDPYQLTDRDAENIELEKGTSGSPCDANISFPVDQGADAQSDILPAPVTEVEMKRQEQAATKAQAAFRGYLARRAFRALKGIIRLQALIRGHLVRRQAVATLRCMHAIVKFQALARGQKVRVSDTRAEVLKKFKIGKVQVDIGAKSFFGSEKLATNAFTRKLLVSLPNAMPLILQYESAEPNSAWNWLGRWSLSHFWVPPARSKKINAKAQRKHGGGQVVEPETGKSRRTIRKVSAAINGDNGVLPSSEPDKPKRNSRKLSSHQIEFVQEQPQSELERVKRNLRKVSASAAASEKPTAESEKPPVSQSVKAAPSSNAPEIPEETLIVSVETPLDSDDAVELEKPSSTEAPIIDEPVNVPYDDSLATETHYSENGEKPENILNLPDELSSKEEENGKDNPKMRKRRSLPAKQEYAENISQNTSSLPSYMAATESAKAKLRAQGSSKFGEESAEHGYVRRHSLPASTNGKLSSSSPRIQKPVQANGKGGSKINRALTTSRDDKTLQPGWRR